VTENEKEILDHDFVDNSEKKDEFKSNVFENVDTETGKKLDSNGNFIIESNNLDSTSVKARDMMLEQEHTTNKSANSTANITKNITAAANVSANATSFVLANKTSANISANHTTNVKSANVTANLT